MTVSPKWAPTITSMYFSSKCEGCHFSLRVNNSWFSFLVFSVGARCSKGYADIYLKVSILKMEYFRGPWVVQSVKRPTLAQVMISQFVSSSHASGSVLTAQSLEPASHSVSPSLSAPSLLMLCLSLSQK